MLKTAFGRSFRLPHSKAGHNRVAELVRYHTSLTFVAIGLPLRSLILPAAPYDAQLRRCQSVRRDAYRSERCIAPLCAFAVGTDEKVSDCLVRVVADQLRAKPSHRDAAIRTVRRVELPQCFL
jgi:hypothetical protein